MFLTPVLIAALQRYLEGRLELLPDEERVFVLRERLSTLRTIQRRLTKYGEEVAVSLHKLRHRLSTQLMNQGMPIRPLRKLLAINT